jgi:hypothetical protein
MSRHNISMHSYFKNLVASSVVIVACGVALLIVVLHPSSVEAGYGQGGYYGQSTYYSQATYYTQSTYYTQGSYYNQSTYYTQPSYYSQGSYAPQSTSVSPTVTTTYTATFTGEGGSGQCEATVTVTEPCTPTTTYTCEDQTIVQTDTDEFCENVVTSPGTCDPPENFCTTGSAICLELVPDGNIWASPRLVPSGGSTQVGWLVEDAESCTVTGNGDTWTGTSGSETSSAIEKFTSYSIACDNSDADTVEDDFTDRVYVYRIPSWLEL